VISEIARLPERRQITERFGAERIARIEDRLSIAWVPLYEHLELVEMLYAAVGVEGYIRFWRRVMTDTLGAPLVAGLVRMSTKEGPMRLLSRGQMVHEALTRGTGVLGVEDPKETSCDHAPGLPCARVLAAELRRRHRGIDPRGVRPSRRTAERHHRDRVADARRRALRGRLAVAPLTLTRW